MNRKQLFIAYCIILFMMIWGFDLINIIKYKQALSWKMIANPFAITQVVYGLVTMLLTRIVFHKYYPAKKFFQLAASVLAVLVFFIALRYTTEEVLMPLLTGARNYTEKTTIPFYIMDNIYYAIIYTFLGFLVFLLDYQVGLQHNQTMLLQKNKEAELAFLRSQVSPHFLFNSLNNIYALSYKKSGKAPEAILKLSELVRYMLYEKKELIPLSEEWNYVQNLLALQQLRYDHPLNIQLSASGPLESILVPPYLLIPFVENVFKHARLSANDDPVIIKLDATAQQVDFYVENSIDNRQKDKTGGIGLDNVQRRLELLYPGMHKLDVQNDGHKFSIHLQVRTNK